MLKQGKLRGEVVRYPDGIGCCIWYPFPGDEDNDERCGICFDFAHSDLNDLIALLQQMRKVEPEVYAE